MDNIAAPITNVKFDIEVALEQQLGAQPLPFPGMDSMVIFFPCPHHYLRFIILNKFKKKQNFFGSSSPFFKAGL